VMKDAFAGLTFLLNAVMCDVSQFYRSTCGIAFMHRPPVDRLNYY